jgi:hypothetical protein
VRIGDVGNFTVSDDGGLITPGFSEGVFLSPSAQHTPPESLEGAEYVRIGSVPRWLEPLEYRMFQQMQKEGLNNVRSFIFRRAAVPDIAQQPGPVGVYEVF